jgi:hypothetical protein
MTIFGRMFGNFTLSGLNYNIRKMKFFEKPRNIYDAVHPFYLILKLFGFVSFSFKKSLDGVQIVTRIYDTIYFIIIFLVHFIFFSALFFRSFVFMTDSSIYKHSTLYMLFVIIIIDLIAMIYQFLKRKNLMEFLEILHEFDGMVNKFILDSSYFTKFSLFSFQTSKGVSISTNIKCTLFFGFST